MQPPHWTTRLQLIKAAHVFRPPPAKNRAQVLRTRDLLCPGPGKPAVLRHYQVFAPPFAFLLGQNPPVMSGPAARSSPLPPQGPFAAALPVSPRLSAAATLHTNAA